MLQQAVQVGHSVGMQLGLECHDTPIVQGALGAIHWHCESGVLKGSTQGPQVVAGLSTGSILESTSGLRNRACVSTTSSAKPCMLLLLILNRETCQALLNSPFKGWHANVLQIATQW